MFCGPIAVGAFSTSGFASAKLIDMTDFQVSWEISRGRFVDAIRELNAEQLNWRLHQGTLTCGEAALHVAGVEAFFIGQLLDESPETNGQLKSCATQGVVNELQFPFQPAQITPELVLQQLELARRMVEPVISAPSPQILEKEIVSALGPIITGRGALARLAFHAGYHQGQVHFLLTAPGFPGR